MKYNIYKHQKKKKKEKYEKKRIKKWDHQLFRILSTYSNISPTSSDDITFCFSV